MVYEVKRGSEESSSDTERSRVFARKKFLIQLLKAGIEMENVSEYRAPQKGLHILQS